MSLMVSIVIPTYNEEADIRETLDSLLALDYDAFEILVVDASNDGTPEIVMSYPPDRVRLIRQSRGKGRAAARNEGVLAAKGEIVVILNADVRLPCDFVQRILAHYKSGADYVLVESQVTNLEEASARYVQALHEFQYPAQPEVEARMNWTEGFSCRRAAVIAVGLIPEGNPVHLVAGEDAWFSETLALRGYNKVFDRSIIVTHVIPSVRNGFWPQRVGRGHGVVQIWYMRYGWPMWKVWLNVALLWMLSGLALLIPLPALWRGWRLSAYSSRRRKDWLTFTALTLVESAANLWGLLKGACELSRVGAQ